MLRRIPPTVLLSTFSIVCWPATTRAQEPHSPPIVLTSESTLGESRFDRERTAATERVLTETLADFDFDRVTFEESLDFFHDQFGINVQANWAALAAVAIQRDIMVKIKLDQVSLATALTFVLDYVGAGETELGFEVRTGVVLVSTREDLSRFTVVRLYDIQDLVDTGYSMRRFANTPVLSLNLVGGETAGGTTTTGQGGLGGGQGGGQAGLFEGGGGSPRQDVEAAEFLTVNTLVTLIQSVIEPEGWRVNGGNVGSVRVYRDQLIVSQTVSAHRQVNGLLQMIRESRHRNLTGEAWIIRMRAEDSDQWRAAIGTGFPRLTPDQVREVCAREKTRVMFNSVTSSTAADRMWFSSLQQQLVIQACLPILGDGVWAAQPVPIAVTEGLELIVVPLVPPAGDRIELDIQMAWMPPADFSTQSATIGMAAASGGTGATAALTELRLPRRALRTVSTATSIADGQAIALTIPNDVNRALDFQDWLILTVHSATPGQ